MATKITIDRSIIAPPLASRSVALTLPNSSGSRALVELDAQSQE
jgi:hypothetical protein